MSSYRKERVSDLLLSFLAEEIRRLTDPRVDFVTLTAIDMSPDLKTAWVYWTVPAINSSNSVNLETQSDLASAFPSPQRIKEVEQGLQQAMRHLKRRVGSELKLRYVPALVFRYDESLKSASRIEDLLRKAGY